MTALAEWVESGRAVDLVIAIVIAELLLFAALRRWPIVIGLLPGLCLLLALRAAVGGSGWQLIALWLIASLPAHIIDLRGRLGR